MKLAECMVLKGITQAELATTLNVTRQTINNWIYGKVPPGGRQMMALYRWSGGKVGLKDWCEEFNEKEEV